MSESMAFVDVTYQSLKESGNPPAYRWLTEQRAILADTLAVGAVLACGSCVRAWEMGQHGRY